MDLDDFFGSMTTTNAPQQTTTTNFGANNDDFAFGDADDDDFGDFQEGKEELPNHQQQQQTTSSHNNSLNNNNNTNDFDDLLSSYVATVSKPNDVVNQQQQQPTVNSSSSLFDFDSNTATTHNNNNNNDVDEDEDDFGDFEQPQDSSSSLFNNNNHTSSSGNETTTFDIVVDESTSSPTNDSMSNPTIAVVKAAESKPKTPIDIMSFFSSSQPSAPSVVNNMTTSASIANNNSSSSSSSLFDDNDTFDFSNGSSNKSSHHDDGGGSSIDMFFDDSSHVSTMNEQHVESNKNSAESDQKFEANFEEDDWGDMVQPSQSTDDETVTTPVSVAVESSVRVQNPTSSTENVDNGSNEKFEANFDNEEDWGSFIDPVVDNSFTTVVDNVPVVKAELQTSQNIVETSVVSPPHSAPAEFEANFGDEDDWGELQSGSQDNVDTVSQQQEQTTDVAASTVQHEEEEEEEPTGSSESDIFNRLIFNERYRDAEVFMKSPKNGSEVWWERERLDHFRSKTLKQVFSAFLAKDKLNQYVEDFVTTRLTVNSLNFASRRLLFQAVNWENKHSKAINSLFESECVTIRLLFQGLKELETCARLLESIQYEHKQGNKQVLDQLAINERLNTFLKCIVEVRLMVEICAEELKRRYKKTVESFSHVVQQRLDLFRQLWSNVQQHQAFLPALIDIASHNSREAGTNEDRCSLSGRVVTDASQLESSVVGHVFAPYKRYYSQRISTFN